MDNDKQLKEANLLWVGVGFVFAFLGGMVGVGFGLHYTFGNYNKTIKILGVLMMFIGFLMMRVWIGGMS